MGENGTSGERDETRATTELQAPPPPPDAPTHVDTPQVAASPGPSAAAAAGPGARGRLRRRLRKLKGVRAKQRVELGTLVFDARKRTNASHPEVVERRAAEAAEVDRQVGELQHAVDAHADTRALATGVAGSCQSCGALLSTEDCYCPACGTPTRPGRRRPVEAPPEAAAAAQPAPTPATSPAPVPAPIPAATPAPAPPPPAADTALAHADRSAIPPPPPPPA